MYWGLPQAIVGFTFLEVVAKPLYLPAFIEGIFALYLLCRCLSLFMKNLLPVHKSLFIFIAFPCLIASILILYPFGICQFFIYGT